jgi:hypothetical protein
MGFIPGCLASWNVDSWARQSPWHIDQDHDWEYVDPNLVHLVTKANASEAVDMLRDEPVLEVSHQKAEHLVGIQLASMDGTKFYLVRAVILNEETAVIRNRATGGYTLRTRDDMLWVTHNCMGGSPAWMKRRALVAQLRKEPREIYPDCHMIQ